MPYTPNPGWELLGRDKFASSLAAGAVVPIEARDMLMIVVRVLGYSGADIASLRFNGDTGANYRSRSESVAAGGVTFTDAPQASATLARLHPTTTTLQRVSQHIISNNLGTSKLGTISALTGSGSAATQSVNEWGGFEWVNTTAQITSVQLLTAGGSITMPAGTGMAIFGMNLA